MAGEKKWESREATDAISLYPEAGNLVAGVSNRIVASGKPGTAFKIVDSRGNAAAEGEIPMRADGE